MRLPALEYSKKKKKRLQGLRALKPQLIPKHYMFNQNITKILARKHIQEISVSTIRAKQKHHTDYKPRKDNTNRDK